MKRIIIDSGICFGKPILEGTRIPVIMVLDLLEDGCSFEEIIRDYYPQLTVDDIKACIHYANQVIKNEEIHLTG
jgi:uncharacterized protein (DUF433 family)